MVKTSKVNVETDFLNVVKHRIKKPYSAQLLKQWKSGNLKFRVSKTLKKKMGQPALIRRPEE